MSMTDDEVIEIILYMGVGRSGLENENSCIAKALKEVQQYRAIGTVSEFRELKEKATAKKPIETERNNLTVWDCPQCGNELYSGQKFCDECGNAIADEFE